MGGGYVLSICTVVPCPVLIPPGRERSRGFYRVRDPHVSQLPFGSLGILRCEFLDPPKKLDDLEIIVTGILEPKRELKKFKYLVR